MKKNSRIGSDREWISMWGIRGASLRKWPAIGGLNEGREHHSLLWKEHSRKKEMQVQEPYAAMSKECLRKNKVSMAGIEPVRVAAGRQGTEIAGGLLDHKGLQKSWCSKSPQREF